jgi:hypothetical protein
VERAFTLPITSLKNTDWNFPLPSQNKLRHKCVPFKYVIINNFGLKTAPAFLASFNACGLGGVNPNYNLATCTPVVTNSQDGLPAGLRQQYLRTFDPRVSVAYRPFKDNKTVVRAGVGILTVTALGRLQNNLESTPQAAVNLWQNNKGGTPLFTFPQVTPPGAGLQFGGGIFEQGVDPHYRDAQSAQSNLTVERELTSNTSFRISYVSMNSYRLNVTENLNQSKPTTSSTPNPVPFQNWGVIYSTIRPITWQTKLPGHGTRGHAQNGPGLWPGCGVPRLA